MTRYPWYINGYACREYQQTLDPTGDRLPMLKLLKLVRSIVVNIGLISLSLVAVSNGGDATVIGVLGLLVLGGYNGLEFSDYLALVRAYEEVQDGE